MFYPFFCNSSGLKVHASYCQYFCVYCCHLRCPNGYAIIFFPQMETNFAGLFLLWISSEFEILLHIQYLKWPPLLIMLFNMVILIALLFKNCSIVWNLIWCEWTLGGSQESVWFLYLSEIQDDRHHWTQSLHEGSMNHPLAYKGGIFYDDSKSVITSIAGHYGKNVLKILYYGTTKPFTSRWCLPLNKGSHLFYSQFIFYFFSCKLVRFRAFFIFSLRLIIFCMWVYHLKTMCHVLNHLWPWPVKSRLNYFFSEVNFSEPELFLLNHLASYDIGHVWVSPQEDVSCTITIYLQMYDLKVKLLIFWKVSFWELELILIFHLD